ncbi:histidine acid phosphatase, partial [Wuchereria bancrofti]
MSLMLTSLNLFTGPQQRHGAYFTHNIIDYALLGHVNLHFMLTLSHLFLLLFNCASNNAFVLRTTDVKAGEHLIYVQAIWRHGDRAPHQLPYPRDLNDESSWPRGWSQLTNMGMKQLYELGLFLRKRYNGYIKEFNSADIRIITSRSDRAIVSAQAMLRGFFPADNIAMQWLKDELWQPISFHSESIERNAPLLHPTLHACSHYNQLMKNETAVIADEMMEKYADVVHLLANVTGIGEKLSFDRTAALIDIQRE